MLVTLRSEVSRMAVCPVTTQQNQSILGVRAKHQLGSKRALPGRHTASIRGKSQVTLANSMALVALNVLSSSSSSMNSNTDREQHPAEVVKDEICVSVPMMRSELR